MLQLIIMEMPQWNKLLGKVLMSYSDGLPHPIRETKVKVADSLNLTKELREEITPKVSANKIEDRVGWAIYIGLKKAMLIEEAGRGRYVITEKGKKVLEDTKGNFDEQYLINNIPEYSNYLSLKQKGLNKNKDIKSIVNDDVPPEELIGSAIQKLDEELAAQLLDELRNMNPYDFESVVADLLKRMGYGESYTTKKSNDGGVDAIVNEDTLGLSKIFAQAKKYASDNIVQEKAVRDFLGSLSANNINKGVFITTSSFSDKAKELVKNRSLILIDGNKLTELMIEYGVGVSVNKVYQIKKLDTDYFTS